jgi:hypothetical protein
VPWFDGWKDWPLGQRVYAWIFVRFDADAKRYMPMLLDSTAYALGNCSEDESGVAAKKVYMDRIDLVKRLKPDCLLFDVKEGWGPLCKYLGKEVPVDEKGDILPFPHLNDSKNFLDAWWLHMNASVNRMLRKGLFGVAGVGILAVALLLGVRK